jgi:predicted nucleotidyltransferase
MDLADLPPDVAQPLSTFVESAGKILEGDLVSVILFGSAAEARLRATSDVNLMLVLSRFEAARADALREPLRLAHALIRLEAMFVLESELADASEAFAVKFADMAARHRVLAGKDVLAGLAPSRESMRMRLRQILLNYILRTRERYVLTSLRDEQNAALVADSAGPLRSAAEIILKLEGRPVSSPKLALEALAHELGGDGWRAPLEHLSTARESGTLPQGVGAPTVLRLIELAEGLRARAAGLGK